LDTETWNKQIFELFDYDDSNLISDSFKINEGGHIYRESNKIYYTKVDNFSKESYEVLLKINKNQDNYELQTNEIKKDENMNVCSLNNAWFLLKQNKIKESFNKYKLQVGDIIKIGRIITQIKDIKFDNKKKGKNDEGKKDKNSNKVKIGKKLMFNDIGNLNNEKETNSKKDDIFNLINHRNATNFNLNDNVEILNLNIDNKVAGSDNLSENDEENFETKINKINISNKAVCRICYTEEEDEKENPLIQPCQCSGSLKYIHLKCLKHWIITKSCKNLEKKKFCSVFKFKEVECEICKEKLPDLVKHNGQLHSLLDFSEEFNNYLILVTLTLDASKSKYIFLVSLDKSGQIKIGRGLINDIVLSDMSVSRIHCLFIIEGKNIYIQDNNSKFGTLILIQTPNLKLIEDLPLYLQIGRTYLNFEIKEKSNFFSCCDISENENIFYYYTQNEKYVKLNRMITIKDDINNSSALEQKNEKGGIRNITNDRDEIKVVINSE